MTQDSTAAFGYAIASSSDELRNIHPVSYIIVSARQVKDADDLCLLRQEFRGFVELSIIGDGSIDYYDCMKALHEAEQRLAREAERAVRNAMIAARSAERRTVDYDALLRIGRELLIAIGEDPERTGIVDTPRRFADMWREFIQYEPGHTETCFEGVTSDQMVVISGLRVWSMCEHHLLPFWADIAIAYISNGSVLGLSKFARIAHQFAHRPQIQEQLVSQIADEVQRIVGTEDIAVLAQGEHLCMTMRGIRTPGLMTSSVMRGAFKDNPNTRSEFLQLIKR